MTKIEEAAWAFAEDLIKQTDENGDVIDVHSFGPESVGLDGRFDFVSAMRAALKVLREPSEAMRSAAGPADFYTAKLIWQNMIDAALNEVKE